jgi:hypothetical protein
MARQADPPCDGAIVDDDILRNTWDSSDNRYPLSRNPARYRHFTRSTTTRSGLTNSRYDTIRKLIYSIRTIAYQDRAGAVDTRLARGGIE